MEPLIRVCIPTSKEEFETMDFRFSVAGGTVRARDLRYYRPSTEKMSSSHQTVYEQHFPVQVWDS